MNYLRLIVILIGVAVLFAIADIVHDVTAVIKDRHSQIQRSIQ
jgi:hypothetical protein